MSQASIRADWQALRSPRLAKPRQWLILSPPVSGIGFIGGGLIFVRGDIVRGLTTAAIVWMTAAIGMACGAGLPVLALVVTAAHFIVVFLYPELAARLPPSRYLSFGLRVVYEDGRGILRQIITESTRLGLAIHRVVTQQSREAQSPAFRQSR